MRKSLKKPSVPTSTQSPMPPWACSPSFKSLTINTGWGISLFSNPLAGNKFIKI
ncbi:MAG: hypothetical protein LCH67_01550 [Bacteroidetes bacterium]|nr:hypothetical protein [Bacteroidota bacterium]